MIRMHDSTLENYAALARTMHALLSEPEPESLQASPEARRVIALGVYRLAVYVSAMPGAQAVDRNELDQLRSQAEELAPPQD